MLRYLTIVLLVSMLGACASNRHQVKQESAGIFAIYGNWCGPDHPKVMDPPPEALDRLDAACMRHDYCYVEKGYLNCDCDKALVKEIKRDLAGRNYNAEQHKYAVSFANYFKGSPCEVTKSAQAPREPEEGVVDKVINTTKAGIGKFMDLVGGDEAQATPKSDGDAGGGKDATQATPEQETPAAATPSVEQAPGDTQETAEDQKSVDAQPSSGPSKVWY